MIPHEGTSEGPLIWLIDTDPIKFNWVESQGWFKTDKMTLNIKKKVP